MGYDGQDRRSFNERVAADREASRARQDASDNWLSAVLVEVEQDETNSAERRATIAFSKRATKRFASYVTKAKSEAEFESRVAVIEDGLRETALQVAAEYGATNGEDMYTAARTAAGDFFYPEENQSPWGPGGSVTEMQGQSEVCPHCKLTKPVGQACPNCGYNAPAGSGGEMGGLQERMPMMATVKEAHPNCTGEGCKFCENKGKMGDKPDDGEAEGEAKEHDAKKKSDGELGDMGTDADEGSDSAAGKQYNKEMKGREQGDDDDDDSKESSVKTAMSVSKKDFNAIAGILSQNGADPGLAQQIADYFATQNQNFDNDRFMDASGAGSTGGSITPDGGVAFDSPPPGTFHTQARTAGLHVASEDMWHAASIHEADGAELRGDKYQYKRVDPDSKIGPGSIADGPSYPTDTVEDVLKGSKDHPSVRKEVLDFDAAENNDPKIKRKVDTEDLGGKNPYTEQKGTDQGSGIFGDSHGVTEAVTDQSDAKLGSTFRFHVL